MIREDITPCVCVRSVLVGTIGAHLLAIGLSMARQPIIMIINLALE